MLYFQIAGRGETCIYKLEYSRCSIQVAQLTFLSGFRNNAIILGYQDTISLLSTCTFPTPLGMYVDEYVARRHLLTRDATKYVFWLHSSREL